MITLFGVKIFLFIFVLSLVWGIFVKTWINGHKESFALRASANDYPWWYLLWGFMLLLDLIGAIYVALYFIFIAW